jgi:hypothetical protein
MTRERDFDDILAAWLDEGVDGAPERFVWAAIDGLERTPQRGRWAVSIEEFLMNLKPLAPILGVIVVAALAVAGYQAFWASDVGGPTINQRLVTEEQLPLIVLTDENAPDGFTVDEQTALTGREALNQPLRPGGAAIDTPAFVDALSVTGGDEVGGYQTWTALFETPEAAEAAFDFIVTEHDSPEGWNLAAVKTDPGLGDESAAWTGQQYDFTPNARTIFWREGNLLLAVVGFADWDAETVTALANQMADRVD